ncbi:MAG: hypothetical protein ACYSTF_04585, partial [Planctomycetota bacterium]
MKNTANLEELIRRLCVAPTARTHERILNVVLDAHDEAKEAQAAVQQQSIWPKIAGSRLTKLAVAAVIIAVVAVGLMHWLPSGTEEIKIPPQLAQMSVQELLDMHFGKTETAFDSSVVAAAVAKALEGLSAQEILAIGQNYSEGSGFAACMIATLPPALSRIVEACDFVVHARV